MLRLRGEKGRARRSSSDQTNLEPIVSPQRLPCGPILSASTALGLLHLSSRNLRHRRLVVCGPATTPQPSPRSPSRSPLTASPPTAAFQVPATTLQRSTRLTKAHPNGTSLKRQRIYDENPFDSPHAADADGYDPHAEKRARAADKAAAKAKKIQDDEDDVPKAKAGFADNYKPPPPPRQFPVFKPKPVESLMKGFRLPGIKRKGVLVETKLTNQALGVRRAGVSIPRPLYDPLLDHAIVLWDPTVDDKEAEREREAERLAIAEREGQEDEAAKALSQEELVRTKVHRSLNDILGIVSREELKKRMVKVPVVIDPRLGKVLRPHQVEGVKFMYRCATGMTDENAHGCIMADEMGLGKTVSASTVRFVCFAYVS